MEELIRSEIRDGIGIITLNRPQQFNSLSLAMHRQLVAALDALEQDATLRCLMIQAEGKHFCTGADLREVTGLRGSTEQLEIFLRTGLESFRRLEQSPLPVVVAVRAWRSPAAWNWCWLAISPLPPNPHAWATSTPSSAWSRAGAAASACRA